nr:hypothetical protein GTC16762_28510 [Pigmentibacter ruber]
MIQNYLSNKKFWEKRSENYAKIFYPSELIKYSEGIKNTHSYWQYSNTNYVLLGKIIENESKKELSNSYKMFFLKNKMYSTFYASDRVVDELVYGNVGSERFSGINVSWLNAGGAVFSTPKDILHFSIKYLKTLIEKKEDWIDTKTGKSAKSTLESAYLKGFFRMNTPYGIVYYTPGLVPGFTTGLIYSPCLATSAAYIVNRSPLNNFHEFMINKILGNLYRNKEYITALKSKNSDKKYCDYVIPSDKFNFTNMN